MAFKLEQPEIESKDKGDSEDLLETNEKQPMPKPCAYSGLVESCVAECTKEVYRVLLFFGREVSHRKDNFRVENNTSNLDMALYHIPNVPFSSGSRKIPVLGMGTAAFPHVESDVVTKAVLEGIRIGLRHFDTAAAYLSEGALGEAIAEALKLGLIKSRDELFITTKLWCADAHADRVIPALQKSLQNLSLEYVDLYLIHHVVSMKPGSYMPNKEDLLALDINGVWSAMEECQTLGLTKSIGVCNFSTKKLGDLLAFAKIPPSVNQVEMNPLWQQKKLLEFCKSNRVLVEIYAPLGAIGAAYGSNKVMENEVLMEIAKAKGKSVAQICLRWAYEQGVIVLFKSYNKERMKQNIEILDWELSSKEIEKICNLPQGRTLSGEIYTSENGPFKSIDELWDGEL